MKYEIYAMADDEYAVDARSAARAGGPAVSEQRDRLANGDRDAPLYVRRFSRTRTSTGVGAGAHGSKTGRSRGDAVLERAAPSGAVFRGDVLWRGFAYAESAPGCRSARLHHQSCGGFGD